LSFAEEKHMASPDELAHGVDVLIAEDDASTRAVLRYVLEHQGYTCAEAEDGREAVELARTSTPRCLLLDLGMPELDGFAVARRLQSDPETRDIPIHCLTGRQDPDACTQASQAGCGEFLVKPVDLARLLEVVRRHVRPPGGGWVTGLTLTEAEDLLDWEENNGRRTLEVFLGADESVGVRRPSPRGLGAGPDEGTLGLLGA